MYPKRGRAAAFEILGLKPPMHLDHGGIPVKCAADSASDAVCGSPLTPFFLWLKWLSGGGGTASIAESPTNPLKSPPFHVFRNKRIYSLFDL